MNNYSTNNRHSDEQLMNLAALGDNSAFDTLYYRHSRRLCGFFGRMLGCSSDEAKDLTHDLFTRIYINRRTCKVNSFATYLYSAAYNMCKSEYRHREIKERFIETQPREEETEEQKSHIDREYITRLLHKTVERLPAAQREVFILRYIEELSTTQVAEIVGCPEGTVKSRLYHALATVTEKMKKYNL